MINKIDLAIVNYRVETMEFMDANDKLLLKEVDKLVGQGVEIGEKARKMLMGISESIGKGEIVLQIGRDTQRKMIEEIENGKL